MNDNKFKESVKQKFDNEVPDVLDKIKASPKFYIPDKNQGFSLKFIFSRRSTIGVLTSVFVILIAIVMFTRNDDVVASTITLDVNPSIEITLNDDDYVIGVTALNDDGEEVFTQDIKYKGLTLEVAIEKIVTRLNQLGYIVTTDENNIILIEVDSDNDEIRTRVEGKLQTKLQTELNKYNDKHWVLNSRDIKLTKQQMERMKQSEFLGKYSAAKLTLIYRINELSDAYTLRRLANMSVRELYNLFISLEDPENLPDKDRMPPARMPNGHTPHNDTDMGTMTNEKDALEASFFCYIVFDCSIFSERNWFVYN